MTDFEEKRTENFNPTLRAEGGAVFLRTELRRSVAASLSLAGETEPAQVCRAAVG